MNRSLWRGSLALVLGVLLSPCAGASGTTGTVATASINGLAADLYKRLSPSPGNLVFSPYSIDIAVAMTCNGANGKTRSQMERVLHAPASRDGLDPALGALDQALASRAGHRGSEARNGDVELSMANALWGQKGKVFEPRFLDALKGNSGAGMNLVDYVTDSEAARNEINTWVSDRTHAKIIDLVPRDGVDKRTRLVLTNAIYFKAPWAKPFSMAVPKPFHKTDGSSPSVPTMVLSQMGTYGEGPGWKAGEIPYLGGELSMVVIVPDNLARFETSLDGARLGAIAGGLKDDLLEVQMPKFTFRKSVQLKRELSVLGMPLAFSDAADFTRMAKINDITIGDVFHQAFIAVDENGSEAAAATAVVMGAKGGIGEPTGKPLIADRPFLFAIRDVPTGAVLFLGRVSDPAASAD